MTESRIRWEPGYVGLRQQWWHDDGAWRHHADMARRAYPGQRFIERATRVATRRDHHMRVGKPAVQIECGGPRMFPPHGDVIPLLKRFAPSEIGIDLREDQDGKIDAPARARPAPLLPSLTPRELPQKRAM